MATYEEKSEQIGPAMRSFEKQIMLQILDQLWKEHLATMDHLRQGIHLRAYAQKNPKQEYKREAFEMFGAMMEQVKHDSISILSRVRIRSEEDVQRMEAVMAIRMETRNAVAWATIERPPGRQKHCQLARQAADEISRLDERRQNAGECHCIP